MCSPLPLTFYYRWDTLVVLPLGIFAWRIEKTGFDTQHLAAPNPSVLLRNLETLSPLTVALRSEGETPPEMTLVLGGDYPVRLNGFHTREVISLDEFLIDRYEVTNGEYKKFVDAGGYSRPEFWSQPDFVKDGRRLSWEEAMATFVDTTDRAGPATWEFGDYPEGTGLCCVLCAKALEQKERSWHKVACRSRPTHKGVTP